MNSPPSDVVDALAVTHDAILGGRLRLIQPARGHRAGTDAVLLAAATQPTAGVLIDVGAGVGTVGLSLALRDATTQVILLEREPLLAALARQNVEINDCVDRVTVAEADILSREARQLGGATNGIADTVVTNPPYYRTDRGRSSPDKHKRSAHTLESTLGDWLRACLALLQPHGTLVLIHRPDALPDIIATLGTSCGAVAIRPVHTHADQAAARILVTSVKGSRAPLQILSPLVLHEADGHFTIQAAALHEGRQLILK